jgi:hypothetical protein
MKMKTYVYLWEWYECIYKCGRKIEVVVYYNNLFYFICILFSYSLFNIYIYIYIWCIDPPFFSNYTPHDICYYKMHLNSFDVYFIIIMQRLWITWQIFIRIQHFFKYAFSKRKYAPDKIKSAYIYIYNDHII